MSLLLRITIVGCDKCPKEAEIPHEISFTDLPLNNALADAGWQNPYSSEVGGYLHLCPDCSKKNHEQR